MRTRFEQPRAGDIARLLSGILDLHMQGYGDGSADYVIT